MPQVSVEIVRTRPELGLKLPEYQSAGSSGLDLCAAIAQPVEIPPGGRELVPTGIAITVQRGYEAQVRPRSGLAARHGITVLNSPGTIDEDFTGEVSVILMNHGPEPFRVDPADRIAQLVIAPVVRAAWIEVTQLRPTDRGAGGMGSTGVKGESIDRNAR